MQFVSVDKLMFMLIHNKMSFQTIAGKSPNDLEMLEGE